MSKANILIVEDDLISANYLKKLLHINNFNVVDIVDNASDAISAFKEHKPDVILMDIMLYGPTSGCELALEIRRFDLHVIIIFLSAHSDEKMIDYALSANAYSYLLKPYRDNDILSTIKMALHLKKEPHKQDNIALKNGYEYALKSKTLSQNTLEIPLSNKLSQLIHLLVRNRGYSVSNEQIASVLSQRDYSINNIRSIIHRLKVKYPDLEIHSISKKGYVIY